MQASNAPTKVQTPFASSGDKQSIPVASQIGIADGRASYTDGFPPLTRTPVVAGGVPPFGTDMNGILYAVTAIQQWQSAGGTFSYDAAFSTAIGGYPKGAILARASYDGFWINGTDNNTANPDTGGAGWRAAFPAGVVGLARNAKMLITAASASATFTADELIVATALNGQNYRVSSFNKTINLGTTGAGGMDTGTAPVSGFVGIYAIYNPTTGASALLATNATSAAAPEVYGGANMPSGYTASALVSVWQTDASRNLVIGFQVGRRISRRPFTAIGGTGPTGGAVTSVSTIGAVPVNTTRVFGSYGMNNSTVTNMAFHIYTGIVSQAGDCFIAINGTNINSNYDICVDSPQAIAYSNTGAGGTFFIYVNGYEF